MEEGYVVMWDLGYVWGVLCMEGRWGRMWSFFLSFGNKIMD